MKTFLVSNTQKKTMSQEQKKIVIIGGGFAGSTAAEKLEKTLM